MLDFEVAKYFLNIDKHKTLIKQENNIVHSRSLKNFWSSKEIIFKANEKKIVWINTSEYDLYPEYKKNIRNQEKGQKNTIKKWGKVL